MEKIEYPPLLQPGFHCYELKDLKALCVKKKAFQKSTTRARLMENLAALIAELTKLNIYAELWIDGSFLTEKIDPLDVDLSLRLDGGFYDNAPAEIRKCLDRIELIHDSHQIHGFLHFVYPNDCTMDVISQMNDDVWRQQWGISRAGIPKGIAVVKLNSEES